jgi:hypothetical protein
LHDLENQKRDAPLAEGRLLDGVMPDQLRALIENPEVSTLRNAVRRYGGSQLLVLQRWHSKTAPRIWPYFMRCCSLLEATAGHVLKIFQQLVHVMVLGQRATCALQAHVVH